MASAAPRHPLRAKSLTLLELCQTVQDLRYASSQTFTRRVYFHPVTVPPNEKQRTSKLVARGLLHVDQPDAEKIALPRKSIPRHDLVVPTRANSKLDASIVSTDTADCNTSTVISALNQISLAPVVSYPPLATKKRTASTRSLYALPNRRKIALTHKHEKKKLDLWQERPSPKDPPCTPLDYATDYDEFDSQPHSSYYSLQDMNRF